MALLVSLQHYTAQVVTVQATLSRAPQHYTLIMVSGEIFKLSSRPSTGSYPSKHNSAIPLFAFMYFVRK